MAAIGLPGFLPVQSNISFNSSIGTTRGIHTELWDKFAAAIWPANDEEVGRTVWLFSAEMCLSDE